MKIKEYWYSLSIILIVIIGLSFPQYFESVGGVKLSSLIKPVLQVIMFGMGATMAMSDFVEVFRSPKKVMIGLFCQFTIMPVLGYTLSRVFNFPLEIAAGIILIGCSPSGLASNVMALLAKANLALSITITAMATLLAPIMTPVLMKVFGAGLIEIDFLKMFFDMAQLVLLPIILGLVINKVFPSLVEKIKSKLPVFSMIGIAYIILVVAASGSEGLKAVGFLLVLAVILHNVFGYTLGYYAAKLFKLNSADARAIALEVGMQNGGLATALANEMGKLATVGLAPGIFGIVMNISGSILANIWSKKPVSNSEN